MNPIHVKQGASKLVEQAADKLASKKASGSAPNPSDQAAFEQAMQGPAKQEAVQQQGANQQVQQGRQVSLPEADQNKSMGARILDQLDAMRTNEKQTVQHIQDINDFGNLSPEQMLKLKVEVDHMAISEQMAVKGVGVAENDLKQLLKQQ